MSFDNDSGHLSDVQLELLEEENPAEEVKARGNPALVPLENRWAAVLSAKNKKVLQHNYEINTSLREDVHGWPSASIPGDRSGSLAVSDDRPESTRSERLEYLFALYI
jgi:hypothetical protein